MSTAKTAPIPWRAEQAGGNWYIMADHGCVQVASCYDQPQSEAHARRIAQAVNSHDALVAACRAVRQQLIDLHAAIADQEITSRFVDDSIDMLSDGRTAIDAADAALAAAEKGN